MADKLLAARSRGRVGERLAKGYLARQLQVDAAVYNYTCTYVILLAHREKFFEIWPRLAVADSFKYSVCNNNIHNFNKTRF
ncbi:uncharacterized protein M421DRAFT_409528 [Didymella exigua CBS 183.55]|uniref:Uncharacterized protein n=1 Tax=Didymella exigua CBS 183.55 TaxID=1150837 RepID=A0A6A5R7P0_9PLEO|nr:uncharacterized protein M421DRAFT_409528 [Didymella exigua CBS 183.55]KAF1922726.1 hypothetical protein M421DRAFT_409528 [Didymella exigua CBS 183.55]